MFLSWVRSVVWGIAFMLCSYSITNAECTQAGVGYSCDTLTECESITPPCNYCPNPLPPSMISCFCSLEHTKNYVNQNQINYIFSISATCPDHLTVGGVIDCSSTMESPGCTYSQPCDPTDPCCSNPSDPCCGKKYDPCCKSKDPCCGSCDKCCKEQQGGAGSGNSASNANCGS